MDFKTLIKIALEVREKRPFYLRPISSTIGRLSDPFLAMTLGTLAPFKRTAGSPEDKEIKEVIEQLKDDPRFKDALLSLGGVRPIEYLKRVWKNKKYSIPGKLYGTITSPIGMLLMSLLRGDYYDPFANVVTLYHKDPAILRHEFGHVEDYSARKYPFLYTLARLLTPVTLYQEAKASALAAKQILDKIKKKKKVTEEDFKELKRLNRVLSGAFGTYVGSMLGGPAAFHAPFLGQTIGSANQIFTSLAKTFGEKGEYDEVFKMLKEFEKNKKDKKNKKK